MQLTCASRLGTRFNTVVSILALTALMSVGCGGTSSGPETNADSRQDTRPHRNIQASELQTASPVPPAIREVTTDVSGNSPLATDNLAKGRRLAIVVGMGNYSLLRNEVTPIPYAKNDATAVHQMLRDHFGYRAEDILSLSEQEATRDRFLSAVSNQTPLGTPKPKDSLLVVFSGRTCLAGESGDAYLLMHDSAFSDSSTWISQRDLKERMSALPCRHKMLVINGVAARTLFANNAAQNGASRSGLDDGRGVGGSGIPPESASPTTLDHYLNTPVFFCLSAGAVEPAFSGTGDDCHTVFIRNLMQVLEKNADSPRADRAFTGRAVASRVTTAMNQSDRDAQAPQWGYLSEDRGGFVFQPTISGTSANGVDAKANLQSNLALMSAASAWNRGDVDSARKLLDAIGPPWNDSFEWKLLWQLCTREIGSFEGASAIGFPSPRTIAFMGEDEESLRILGCANHQGITERIALPARLLCAVAHEGLVAAALTSGDVLLYRQPFRKADKLGSGIQLDQLSVSRGGSYLAGVTRKRRSVVIWNLATETRNEITLADSLSAMEISSRLGVVIIGSVTGKVEIRDLESGELRGFLQLNDAIDDVACSPNSDALTVASGGQLLVWNIDDSNDQYRILEDKPSILSSDSEVRKLTFVPDGSKLLAGSSDGKLSLFEWPSRKSITVTSLHDAALKSLEVSADGMTLMSQAAKHVKTWDLRAFSQTTVESLNPEQRVVFANSNEHLMDHGKSQIIWHRQTLRRASEGIPEELQPVNRSGGRRQGAYEFQRGQNYSYNVIDQNTGKTTAVLENVRGDLHLSPDGKVLIEETDEQLTFWDIQAAAPRMSLSLGQGVGVTAFSPDSKALLLTQSTRVPGKRKNQSRQWLLDTAATDRDHLQRWEARKGEAWAKAKTLTCSVMATSSVSQRFAIAVGSRVRVFALAGLKQESTFSVAGEVRRMCFSPQGDVLLVAAGRYGHSLFLFDLRAKKQIARLDDCVDDPRGWLFAESTPLFVAQKSTVNYSIVDLATGEVQARTARENIKCMAISPDQRTIAIGMRSAVEMRDLESGKLVAENREVKGECSFLNFAPSGDSVLYASRYAEDAVQLDASTLRPRGLPVQARNILWMDTLKGDRLLLLSRTRAAVYDLASGQALHQFQPRFNGNDFRDKFGVRAARHEHRLAIENELWDLRSGKAANNVNTPRKETTVRVAFSPDGSRLAQASSESIHLWHCDTESHLVRISLSSAPMEMSFVSDSTLICRDQQGQALIFQDGETGTLPPPSARLRVQANRFTELHSLQTELRDANSMSMSPDGERILLGSPVHGGFRVRRVSDLVVEFADNTKGQLPARKWHRDLANGLPLRLIGRHRESRSKSSLRLFTLNNPAEAQSLSVRGDLDAFAFHSDGNRFLYSAESILWRSDLEGWKAEQLTRLRAEHLAVDDSFENVVGTYRRELTVVNLKNGRKIGEAELPRDPYQVAISGDGQRVAVTGYYRPESFAVFSVSPQLRRIDRGENVAVIRAAGFFDPHDLLVTAGNVRGSGVVQFWDAEMIQRDAFRIQGEVQSMCVHPTKPLITVLLKDRISVFRVDYDALALSR